MATSSPACLVLESTAALRVHCTAASHAHAKATPSVWRTWLPCGEPMVIEADEFGPGYSLELKTCPICFSTCAVEVQS